MDEWMPFHSLLSSIISFSLFWSSSFWQIFAGRIEKQRRRKKWGWRHTVIRRTCSDVFCFFDSHPAHSYLFLGFNVSCLGISAFQPTPRRSTPLCPLKLFQKSVVQRHLRPLDPKNNNNRTFWWWPQHFILVHKLHKHLWRGRKRGEKGEKSRPTATILPHTKDKPVQKERKKNYFPSGLSCPWISAPNKNVPWPRWTCSTIVLPGAMPKKPWKHKWLIVF